MFDYVEMVIMKNMVKTLTKTNKNILRFEKAKFKDMKRISNIISSSAEMYRPFVNDDDFAEHMPDETWRSRNYFRRDFYLARDACGENVATISLQNLNGHAYLGYVYIDIEHTGKGYGRQLLDHAKEYALSRDLEGMFLIAHPKAKWATKAYTRYGFSLKETSKGKILEWNKGALKPYYEEGFHLYYYSLNQK